MLLKLGMPAKCRIICVYITDPQYDNNFHIPNLILKQTIVEQLISTSMKVV